MWMHRLTRVVALCVMGLTTGCTVLNAPKTPGQILKLEEPDLHRGYYLYVPSGYTPDQQWPVVAVCHAASPLDNAKTQIDEWKGLAESKLFLVLAPELNSVSGSLSKDPAGQLAKMRADEEAVLAILAHVRAARSVDPDRIFMVGWLGGAYPALYIGMRNPEVFRGIALRQPYFKAEYVEPCAPRLDYYQSIHVLYGPTDLYRDEAKACVDWLHQQRMSVTDQESTTAHHRKPGDTYSFMQSVVKTRPFIRVHVETVSRDEPLAVRFEVRSSLPVKAYDWDFGDGRRDKVATPEHTYATAGSYTVRVAVTAGGKQYRRQLQIRVPATLLGAGTQPSRQ